MTEHNRVVSDVLDYLNYLPESFAFPTHGPRNHPAVPGISDIICCYKGGFIAVEVKVGNDKMSNAQDEFGMQVSHACGVHCVVRGIEDMRAALPRRKRG